MSGKYTNIHINIKPADFITKPSGLQSPILCGLPPFQSYLVVECWQSSQASVHRWSLLYSQPKFSLSSPISTRDFVSSSFPCFLCLWIHPVPGTCPHSHHSRSLMSKEKRLHKGEAHWGHLRILPAVANKEPKIKLNTDGNCMSLA